MSKSIPNFESIGQDFCLSAIQFDVPVLLIENGCDCYWYHELMTETDAEKLSAILKRSRMGTAHIVKVGIVLPPAIQVRESLQNLDTVQGQPVRITLIGE